MREKLNQIRKLIDDQSVNGILIESLANFQWLSGGQGYIGLGSEMRAHYCSSSANENIISIKV